MVPEPAAWSRWLATWAPDAGFVEYWIGDESAYCWLVDQTGVTVFELGDAHAIDSAARALHAVMSSAVTTGRDARIEATAALSRLVLRPLDAALSGHKQLLVVPDQALGYVPFAALVTSASPHPHYLVESHEIAIAPAIWWLFRGDAAQTLQADDAILIVADPVYERSDPRLAGHAPPEDGRVMAREWAGQSLTRLPAAAREVAAVAQLFPVKSVRRLEGTTATRSGFLAEPLGRYRYIHVASHAFIDARMPELASLVLSTYGDHGVISEPAVRAADLMTLKFRADVVALSACETALGKGAVGEGAIGLSYAALARGAHSVLASLWTISDEISADVMTDFYGELRHEHSSPSAALAAAMRAVLKARPGLDPAYWAAYQLTVGVPPKTTRSGDHP